MLDDGGDAGRVTSSCRRHASSSPQAGGVTIEAASTVDVRAAMVTVDATDQPIQRDRQVRHADCERRRHHLADVHARSGEHLVNRRRSPTPGASSPPGTAGSAPAASNPNEPPRPTGRSFTSSCRPTSCRLPGRPAAVGRLRRRPTCTKRHRIRDVRPVRRGDRNRKSIDLGPPAAAVGTRKLFLPAHHRFYLAAVGLHCDRAGFPMVDPAKVDEVGFVDPPPTRRRPAAEIARASELLRESTLPRPSPDQVCARRPPRNSRGSCIRSGRGDEHGSRRRGRDARRPPARSNSLAGGCGLERPTASAQRTQGWVPTGEGSFGNWVPMRGSPDELIERTYPMRLLTPVPTDPDHAAHDGTIYFAAVPTASDEVTAAASPASTSCDTYEIRVFARRRHGDCPGPLTWSAHRAAFRLASFYDPAGWRSDRRDIRLPDFGQLEASAAMPSVRMSAPSRRRSSSPSSGAIPTQGQGESGGGDLLLLDPAHHDRRAVRAQPVLADRGVRVQLWWMLKLKFCIPPSIGLDVHLAAELEITPGELGLTAELGIDVQTNEVTTLLKTSFDPTDRALRSRPHRVDSGRRTDRSRRLHERGAARIVGRSGSGHRYRWCTGVHDRHRL